MCTTEVNSIGSSKNPLEILYPLCMKRKEETVTEGTERRFGGRPEIKIILCSMNDTLI